MEEVPLNKSFVFIPENMENIESWFFCEYDPHGAKSRVAKAERDFC